MASFIPANLTPPKTYTDTFLIRTIVDVYSMDARDISDLAAQLETQMVATYRMEVQRNLVLYKCQKTVTGPDAEAAASLRSKAQTDAAGIAATYNRELQNQVESLFAANRRGNRSYYIKNLESWTTRRNAYKLDSIALNTMTSAREYAAQRFRRENNIQGRMVFVGPSPVCIRCVRLKALGPVSVEQAQKYGDSQHVNCPHRWEGLIPKAIECGDLTWTG